MSAQPIMSVPTPAMPAAPQGATSTVVSGFEGLLAAMFQMADADEAVAKPAVTAEVDAEKVIGFLAAPPPAPPVEAPLAPEPAANSAAPAPAEPRMTAPEPPTSDATPAVSAEAAAPTESAAEEPAPPSLPMGEDLEAAVVAGKAAETAAQAKSATQAAPAQTPQPAPPPLRPLAERTSRSAEEVAKDAGSSPDTVKAAAATEAAPNTTSVFDVSALANPTDAPLPPTEAEVMPVDALPAGEGEAAAPQTAATHAVRETSPSAMSRVAVEATAQIAAQIIRRLEGRSTRFEMSLLPEELGRVDVKLEIGSDGRLSARLAFDNPLAATDLRGRADELRRELEAQGFQMADDAFEFAERDSGSHAFDRGQDSRDGRGRAFSSAARLNAEADVVQPRWTQLSLSPSGVDLKV